MTDRSAKQIARAATRGERRTPFYFAGPQGPLFACYHEPVGRVLRGHGAVLCHPFGQEYIRAHRSFAQLATRLAHAGVPVLRFDFFGCGDSAGDSEAGSLAHWLADVGAAADELRRRAGCDHVDLVGLRLGASLAALGAQDRDDVRSLVLWDPVLDGAAYLRELVDNHRRLLRFAYITAPRTNGSAPELEECGGFPLGSLLRAELQALDLATPRHAPAARVLLIQSGAVPGVAGLRTGLENRGVQVRLEQTDDPQVWELEPFRRVVPQRTLEAIAAWLTEESV